MTGQIITWNDNKVMSYWFRVTLLIRQRVIETFSSIPSLSRRWRDHFKELRTGEAYPLPVPLAFARGQGVPHSVTP